MDFYDLLGKGGSAVRSKAAVIHFPILCQSGMLHAIVADQLKLVNTGAIPRIYFRMILETWEKQENIISKLRGIFVLPNVRFSVRSVRHGVILLCASYIKKTSASTPASPSPSGPLVS